MTDGYRVKCNQAGTPFDYEAPDGSEIRLLSQGFYSGLCHCTLRPGQHSGAVSHRTVEELWYFLSGHGVRGTKRRFCLHRRNTRVGQAYPCGL